MNLGKKQLITIGCIVIFLVSIFSIAVLVGFNESNKSNDNNATGYYAVLSTTDKNILDSAYDEYEALKQTFSIGEAREQLIEKLNNETDGVEIVELGLDGYTIFLTFSDGDFAAVDTYEPDEEYSSTSGYSNLFSSLNNEQISQSSYDRSPLKHENHVDISFSTYAEVNTKIIPGSKKVLILGPAYYDFNTEPFEQSIQYFKDHGWTDDDIVMKVVDKRNSFDVNYGNLKPEDFFDLEDYGIILYTGHGGVKIYNNYEEDNIYLQFCFITNDTYNTYPDFKTWKDEKKLLISKCDEQREGDEWVDWYTTSIRADVLREKLNTLPSSYMHLSACYGAHFNKVFLDHGAKMFLGWTWKADGDIADGNMLNLNRLLLENTYNLYNAYMDDNIVRSQEFFDNYFNIYSDGDIETNAKNFYFPAWVDLTIIGIPGGISTIETSLYDSSNTLITKVQNDVGIGTTQIVVDELAEILLAPTENVRVEVSAYDGSNTEVASGQTTTTLDAGKNSMNIALGNYAWALSGSAEDPRAPIDSTNEVARLNEEPVFEFEGCYPSFGAVPGDSLRIFYITTRYYGYCDHMGPIWLHCLNNGYTIQLTEYLDLGCYYDETPQVGVILYDQTFTIPEPYDS